MHAEPALAWNADVNFFDLEGQRSIRTGVKVLQIEARALGTLAKTIDDSFEQVVSRIVNLPGRVIVTGMGKSGHVARKISATLASTGTPSFFVHPGEASHGDLGMISRQDAVVALSNSGETVELSNIIEYTRRFTIPLVAMTGNPSSTLAKRADYLLQTPHFPEACPLGLAPTTSTTMMLALGDALAVALLERRGFSAQDFKVFHPGGKLGQRLQMVQDVMRTGKRIPLINSDSSLTDAIMEMTTKGCGCTGIVEEGQLVGIITDGDLRRHLDSGILQRKARDLMSRNPKSIHPQSLIAEAVAQMSQHGISSLFVTEAHSPVGIIHIHDCLGAESAGMV